MTFNDIFNSERKVFSTANANGKPTVLFFISTACTSSFSQLSRIDELYLSHKHDLNMLLIGIDLDDNIREHYQRYKEKYDLHLPIAFDKTVYRQYAIKAVPTVIWIDKFGFIQAITNVFAEKYIDRIIAGEQFEFIDYSREGKERRSTFTGKKLLVSSFIRNGDTTLIQGSWLARWSIEMPTYMPSSIPPNSPLKGLEYLQVMGRDLSDLYRIAYFGRTYAWEPDDTVAYGHFHFSPRIEIKDRVNFSADYNLGLNLFCYSQILPLHKRTPSEMMKVMQRDLKNYFGYRVKIVDRKMPYLALVANDKSRKRLSVRNENTYESTVSLINVNYVNVPVSRLIHLISNNNKLTLVDRPLFDETGIKSNISISLNAIMTDLDDVKAALRRYGLDIVEKRRTMKVIVISD